MSLIVDECFKCRNIRELYPRSTGPICFSCIESTEPYKYKIKVKSNKKLKEVLKIDGTD